MGQRWKVNSRPNPDFRQKKFEVALIEVGRRTVRALPQRPTDQGLDLLREHELHLGTDLPVRTEVGLDHVVVRADLCVHRQPAEMEDLGDAAMVQHRSREKSRSS